MVSLFYKWYLLMSLFVLKRDNHPIFLTVTQIEHNATNKTLEISCKLFTDDFEKTLRKQQPVKIDLLDPALKTNMNPIVNSYIRKHLLIKVNGQSTDLQFIGFEQQEEGIMTYFQITDIPVVKKIEVMDNLLFEFSEQQMGIVHVLVNGNRKSSRLNNPDCKVSFDF